MRIRSILLAAATVLTLTACDAAAEQLVEEAAEQAVGGNAEIDVDDEGGSVSVETDDGSVQISSGEDAELPEGFPSGVPLPDGYSVISATAFSDDSGTSFLVSLQVTELDVASYLEDTAVPGLEAEGFEVVSQSTSTTGDITIGNVQADDGTSVVTITAQGQSDGPPVVSIQVSPSA